MRAGKVDRVKRRLLRAVVAENLETIQGLPPRNVRPRYLKLRIFIRRASLVVVPLMLAGSTYLASNPTSASSARDTITPAKIVIRAARPPAHPPSIIDATPFNASVFPLAVHRVVIDAGHGGTDPGAISFLRLSEKQITLDVASRLKSLLEKNGFEVVITRDDDRLIPLRERARIANASESDIFISIHVNAILNHTASHGVETYYLGPTNDKNVNQLAADENRLSGYSMVDLRKLLDGVYADARRDESHRLALAVQSQLFGSLSEADRGLENWGVKRAPFIVLVATEMPAILAEVGCISNTNEAAMLGQPEYRQKIAEALFRGIHSYASAGDAPQKKGT